MTLDATKVRVAVSGGVLRGVYGSTAPTSASSSPDAAFKDLGYMNEDGVEISLPDAGDTEVIHAWQNSDTVRILRNTSDDNPTWVFTMLETKKETIETYFGVAVTDADGSFTYTGAARSHFAYIVHSIDGANLHRDYIPYGLVTSVSSHTLVSTGATEYQVTVTGEKDATAGFMFKRWTTALIVP